MPAKKKTKGSTRKTGATKGRKKSVGVSAKGVLNQAKKAVKKVVVAAAMGAAAGALQGAVEEGSKVSGAAKAKVAKATKSSKGTAKKRAAKK